MLSGRPAQAHTGHALVVGSYLIQRTTRPTCPCFGWPRMYGAHAPLLSPLPYIIPSMRSQRLAGDPPSFSLTRSPSKRTSIIYVPLSSPDEVARLQGILLQAEPPGTVGFGGGSFVAPFFCTGNLSMLQPVSFLLRPTAFLAGISNYFWWDPA